MEISGNIEWQTPTAPELVLDLLVAEAGELPVAALCRAASLFGMNEQVMRVALTRLRAQGKVRRTARGRYTVQRGRLALTEVVDQWQQRQTEQVAWQGQWVAVADGAVRRQDKTDWRRHALALQLRGFAMLAPGLCLRPDNLVHGVAGERQRLQALGLSPLALVLGLQRLEDDALVRAQALWRGAALPAHYRALATALRRSARRLPRLSLADATRESLLAGRTVIAQLLRDPLLPGELMDASAREQLLASMRDYQQQARALCRAYLALAPEEL